MSNNILPMPLSNKIEDQQKSLHDFNKWLDNALPGDRFCYFIGDYLRGPVGGAASKAYDCHQVILFQKREGKHFAYWAQKAGKIDDKKV